MLRNASECRAGEVGLLRGGQPAASDRSPTERGARAGTRALPASDRQRGQEVRLDGVFVSRVFGPVQDKRGMQRQRSDHPSRGSCRHF